MNLPFARKMEPVSIQRECYAMDVKEGNSAEITMYGQIVERRPVNWWTGEPMEGNYIIKSEFLKDLEAIKNARKLTIRLDSLGGDAYASLLIHNRLRDFKAKKTILVDGVAMSGGSIIMCASDTVKVNPGSLIMVHKSLAGLYGWYNEDDLEQIKQSNIAADKALASVYARKTGKDDAAVIELMKNQTYLTGKEAVEQGFADELLQSEDAPQIAASADHTTLYVNGRALSTMGYPMPKDIPVMKQQLNESDSTKEIPLDSGKGEEIMAKTLIELKAENPELAESIMAEARTAASADISAAAAAERQRLRDIDSIASIYSDELVNEAKYGDKACSAQDLAFRAAQETAKRGKDTLKDMEKDAEASGAQAIGAAPAPDETGPLSPEQRRAQGKADAQATKKE